MVPVRASGPMLIEGFGSPQRDENPHIPRDHDHVPKVHGGDEGQHARIDVTIEISDLKHLEKVIKSLRGVDGVLGVERAGRAG